MTSDLPSARKSFPSIQALSLLMLHAFLQAALLSCGEEKEITVEIEEKVLISGSIDATASQGEKLERFKLRLIDAEGVRGDELKGSLLPDGQLANLEIPEASLSSEMHLTTADRLAAFSHRKADESPTELKDRPVSYARIELHDAEAADSSFAYAQLLIPIEKDAFVQKTRSAQVDPGKTPLRFNRVTSVQVQVHNEDGEALENVLLSIMPFRGEAPILPWADTNLRPVTSKSDADGAALLFPVPFEHKDSAFQVAAYAEGYCTAISEKQTSRGLHGRTLELVLKRCETPGSTHEDSAMDLETLSPLSLSFENAASIKELAASETDAGERGLIRGYFNDSEVIVRIDYAGTTIGPTKIEVFHDRTLSKPLQAIDSPHPLGRVRLDLAPFIANKDDASHFTIKVSAISVGDETVVDGTAIDSERKRSQALIFASIAPAAKDSLDLGKIAIQSSARRANIISGVSGQSFFVSTSLCPPDGTIALKEERGSESSDVFDVEDLHFVPCDKDFVAYQSKHLGLKDKSRGGYRRLAIFVKDVYGNIQTSESGQGKEVYVDFGVADLEDDQAVDWPGDLNLSRAMFPFSQSEWGLHSSEETEAELVSLVKDEAESADPIREEQSLVALNFADLKDYRIGFVSPERCRHTEPSLKDGPGTIVDRGHLIHAFALASTKSAAKATNTFTPCKESLQIADLVSKKPEKGKAIELFLKIQDQAGNISNVQKIVIPYCKKSAAKDDDEAGLSFCWK